ncbi:hypothetical protein PITCH_A1200002 [uncultured Desulfobacterium sp.]|uniref:PEP-CTERM protein-sorting domain-containing protein n=1 Tax=uncultured Desulfobacterium sp. TaxID=201089 RepID=A0A445MRV0_9BACT|nr:hypothetical protein PITCH_A1200002 [uncultured Desulfobacterium sp.]
MIIMGKAVGRFKNMDKNGGVFMESLKFFVAAISVLVLTITLPAYAEVRYFSGDLTSVVDPVGHLNDAFIDSSINLTGSVTFDLNNVIDINGDRYIDGPTQINMMLGTLSFNQNDSPYTTRLYFDESDNLIGIDFCTSQEYKYFDGNSYGFRFKSIDYDNFTTFKIWANDNRGTTLSGTYDFTQIPIPGAIWLLASGLIGLAGLKRKIVRA